MATSNLKDLSERQMTVEGEDNMEITHVCICQN